MHANYFRRDAATLTFINERGVSAVASANPHASPKGGSFVNKLLHIGYLAIASMLGGCASISVLAPASGATVSSPVPADVFWNAQMQANSLRVVVDPGAGESDVSSQFAVPSLSADAHATASLGLAQGAHTIRVDARLWDALSQSFSARTASRSFQVANGPGRPVTYTETIFNFSPGWPAGQLGNVSFGGSDPQALHRNVNLVFTFSGNTSDVVAYFVPRSNPSVGNGVGFEIVAGTGTITVEDAATHATIAQATFLPAAGVFVSVDNGNGGVGFGCRGALPTDPAFPNHGVEVAYPYAQFRAPQTDLKSNYTASADWALSCAGFNGSPGQGAPGSTCHVPISLPTTLGALTITPNDQQDLAPAGVNAAVFTTVLH